MRNTCIGCATIGLAWLALSMLGGCTHGSTSPSLRQDNNSFSQAFNQEHVLSRQGLPRSPIEMVSKVHQTPWFQKVVDAARQADGASVYIIVENIRIKQSFIKGRFDSDPSKLSTDGVAELSQTIVFAIYVDQGGVGYFANFDMPVGGMLWSLQAIERRDDIRGGRLQRNRAEDRAGMIDASGGAKALITELAGRIVNARDVKAHALDSWDSSSITIMTAYDGGRRAAIAGVNASGSEDMTILSALLVSALDVLRRINDWSALQ